MSVNEEKQIVLWHPMTQKKKNRKKENENERNALEIYTNWEKILY